MAIEYINFKVKVHFLMYFVKVHFLKYFFLYLLSVQSVGAGQIFVSFFFFEWSICSIMSAGHYWALKREDLWRTIRTLKY